MENFKTWLQNEEFTSFLLDEGISAKWAAVPLAVASLLSNPSNYDNKTIQKPLTQSSQITQNQNYVNLNKIANAINQKFNVNIDSNQIQLIKPVDIIKPMYGDKWQQVYDKAKDKQNTQKIGDIEIPALNSFGVTNVNNLNEPIPVIFASPTKFGQSDNVNGFCTTVFIGTKMQKVCVVKDRSLVHTLRHELSHATQDSHFMNASLGGEGQFGDYFMNEKELGVRIAEFKRNYYQLTGEIVNGQSDVLAKALKHLLLNTEKYSPDVQQLKPIIEKARKEGLLPRLFDFFKDNIDKMVKNSNNSPRNYA